MASSVHSGINVAVALHPQSFDRLVHAPKWSKCSNAAVKSSLHDDIYQLVWDDDHFYNLLTVQ